MSAWAETYAAARALARLIRPVLSGWSNPLGTPAISMVHEQVRSYAQDDRFPGEDRVRHAFSTEYLVQYSE